MSQLTGQILHERRPQASTGSANFSSWIYVSYTFRYNSKTSPFSSATL